MTQIKYYFERDIIKIYSLLNFEQHEYDGRSVSVEQK